METKKFTQFGTFTVVIFLPLFLLFTGLFKSVLAIGPDTHIYLALTFLICLLLFYKLTIIVDNVNVSFKLGIGLIGKSYKIENINSCKPVTNSLFNGLGIHMLENGWLYNVSGLKAIELSFKDKFSIIRIGTDRPDEISDYITRLINKDGSLISNLNVEQKSKKKINTSIMVGFITLLLVIFLILFGNQEIKINSDNNSFQIKTIYGISIKYNEISQLDTLSSIPNIEFKNHGYAFGNVYKGNFKLAGINNAKLFVKTGIAPYLHIKLSNSDEIFINFKDNKKTVALYKFLVEKIRK